MNFSTKTIDVITNALVTDINEELRKGKDIHFNEVEQAMREILQKAGRESLGRILTEKDHQRMSVRRDCPCGEQTKRDARRKAKLLSVFGWTEYKRSYYRCPHCGESQFPLDEEEHLTPGQATPEMAKLVGLAGIIEPFEKAQEVLEQYLLVSVSPNTIRKETQRIGTKQEQKEAQWIQQSQDPAYLRKQDRTVKNRPKRLYGSIDGAYVPVKKEWKEAKTVSWYEADTPYGRDTLRAKDIFYYTSLEQAEEFGKLMWGSGVHHHAHLAQEVVFVCDGASWIWKLVDFYFPQATQILDWYHACEYLYPIAEALHDPESEEYVRWVEAKKEALWAGQVKAVIRALKRLVDHPQAGEDARKAVTYYDNNQSRMDYARYRAEGYFIGSGTVESACKQIVSMRLKCPGARWSQEGALATAKARTSWLNGQLDQTSALPLAV